MEGLNDSLQWTTMNGQWRQQWQDNKDNGTMMNRQQQQRDNNNDNGQWPPVMSCVIPCHNPYLLPKDAFILLPHEHLQPSRVTSLSHAVLFTHDHLWPSRAMSLSCAALFMHDHPCLPYSWYSFLLHSWISQSMSAIYASWVAHTCC